MKGKRLFYVIFDQILRPGGLFYTQNSINLLRNVKNKRKMEKNETSRIERTEAAIARTEVPTAVEPKY